MKYTSLITGSTSGIGKAFSELLASKKHSLVLVSRNLDKLEKQKSDLLLRYDVSIEIIASDLSEPSAARELFAHLSKKGIEINILINNAGFNEVGKFLETDMQKEGQMISLHTLFSTEITKLLLPTMCRNRFGKILNIGSTGSYIPTPNDAVYSATKAYLLSFSKALHYELKGTGVSATCICPGATSTEFAEKAGLEQSLLFKLFVMKPEKVAANGYSAMMKNSKVNIVGLYNKLMVFSYFVFPDSIINYFIGKMM